MATIRYRINEKSKSNPTKIYVRFRGENFDCETPTEIQVYKNDWSASKQKLKSTGNLETNRIKINNQLDELKKLINDQFNEDYTKGFKIDTNWLKSTIKNFHNQPLDSKDKKDSNLLTEYAKIFIENLQHKRNKRTGQPLKKRTIQDYENSVEKIKQFENQLRIKTKLDAVDLKFHSDFIHFLRSVDMLGENTIGGIITNLKTILKDADLQGLKVNNDFKKKLSIRQLSNPKIFILTNLKLKKFASIIFKKIVT